MNKEKAIKFVLKNLGISSFDNLSISYDYIKQNGKIILNREFYDKLMYVKIRYIIKHIWEIEKHEKEIDKLINDFI